MGFLKACPYLALHAPPEPVLGARAGGPCEALMMRRHCNVGLSQLTCVPMCGQRVASKTFMDLFARRYVGVADDEEYMYVGRAVR